MIDPKHLSLTQTQMSILSRTHKSTISRFISNRKINYLPLDSGTNKYSIQDSREIIRHFMDKVRGGELCTKDDDRKIFVFYNFKGGVGKSVISSQTALHLAIMGFKVLAIDLDPQAHMTLNSGLKSWRGKTMYNAMIEGCDLEEVIINVLPGLDIVPANLGLTKLELPLVQKNQREMVLSKILKTVYDDYDYIIIDTNPTISVLNINALVAACQINIPCATQPLAYNGLGLVTEGLKELFSDIEKDLNFKIIPNLYDVKTITSQEILGALRSEYGRYTLSTVIHKCEDINISSKSGMPLITFAKKNSSALEDIVSLIHELVAPQNMSRERSDYMDSYLHKSNDIYGNPNSASMN